MHHKFLLLTIAASALAAASAQASPDDLRYRATINYGYMDRFGNGADLSSNSGGITLSEQLSGHRTQFVSLGGSLGNFEDAARDIDSHSGSIAYGMSWGGLAPGLTVFASGFANKNWNDYDRGTANTLGRTSTSSSGIGLAGGINQIIPIAAKTALSVGTGLSIGHSYINDLPTSNEGNSIGVTPYVQVSHLCTKDTHAYARLGMMLSSRDVTLSGGNTLYTPAIGVDHRLTDEYSVGASYGYEFAPGMRGNRFGISLTRAF